MQETEAPSRRARTRAQSDNAAELTCEERRTIEQGRLFRRLPPELQDAILGRAYVWRLKDGEQVLPEDQAPEHWIGVASGELLGRTRSLENGQTIATHVLAPGDKDCIIRICQPVIQVEVQIFNRRLGP